MLKLKLTKEEILLTIIKAATKKYEEQLYLHPATKLYNRRYLMEFGDLLLQEKAFKTLVVFDVRNLHTYNEIFGHRVTDGILRSLGGKIREFCGKGCLVGSLECGRFWLLTKEKEEVPKLLKDLINYLTSKELKVRVDRTPISVLISLNGGYAFYPEHGKTIANLLIAADIAADRSKEQGTNTFTVYDKSLEKPLRENLEIEARLREAIKSGAIEGQIYPVFQLKVDPKTNRITGAEVLMRWTEHGQIFKVIQVAEKTGLLDTLFEVLVKKSADVIKRALSLNPQMRFSYNISPVQLGHTEELLKTLALFEEKGVSPDLIEVEITETELLKMGNVLDALNKLTSKGFLLSIDDFGKGYSSFDRLMVLDIYGVKIDRDLVKDLLKEENVKESKPYKFLKNLVLFLKGNEYRVTVEGVEDRALVELLKEMDIDDIQGYYYSHPVREETFLSCLKGWGRSVFRCQENPNLK